MNRTWTAVAAAFALTASARHASAQEWSGFVTGGQEFECCAVVRGGALVSVGSWLLIGAEADLLVSLPYATGRGGPIGQVNLRRTGRLRPFVSAGYMFGETRQPVVGAGLDVWIGERQGIRIAVQDGFQHYSRYCYGNTPAACLPAHTDHSPSLLVGIVWR